VCIVVVIWAIYGYSLTFTGGSSIIGGSRQALPQGRHHRLAGGPPFSVGVTIHELIYICFQMTFRGRSRPALIVGAFAERMKFLRGRSVHPAVGDADLLPDRPTWSGTGAGPDAIQDAAKILAAATDEAAKKARAGEA